MRSDKIIIVINGVEVSGWTEASVSAGITRIPRQGVLQLCRVLDDSLRTNGAVKTSPLEQPCQILVGGELVLTGYICVIDNEVDEDQHRITYEVRGMTCDLIDSTAEFFGANNSKLVTELRAMTVAQLIDNICKVYSINVIVEQAPDGVPTNAEIQYPGVVSINIGDSAYTAVEQLAKYAGCLVYEDAMGNLILGWPGSEQASQTVLTHQNVKKSKVRYDSTCLYANYFAMMQSAVTQQDAVGSISVGVAHYPFFDSRLNPYGQPRVRNYRKIFDVAQLPNLYTASLSPQQVMANYLMQRYAGQSQVVTVETKGWRDLQGNLWTPNQLVRVTLEHQSFDEQWLVTDVAYNLTDTGGTTATLVLMPPNAFSVEPSPIAQNADVAALTQSSNSNGSAPAPATNGLLGSA